MSAAPSIDEQLAELRGRPDAATNVAPAVRRYLEDVRSHLAELHRSPRSGRLVNEANSDLIDRLIRRLVRLAEEQLMAAGEEPEDGLCVVAVGGYARREMSIHSDVDLLVLYRDILTPFVGGVAERLQYWLWDAGLTVGCATRTISETVNLGLQDATVRTAVLSARFLCGDGEFFHEFADTLRSRLMPDLSAFIADQQKRRAERHARFGESLFLLQPNLKEGAGALRDYHTAYWVARGTQPSTRGLDDLLHFGLLTESEMAEYGDALEFLWRARNQLHLMSGRGNDQMSFELQERAAEALGYAGGESNGEELAVEKFMRDYYRHAHAIQNYSDLVIEQCAARVASSSRKRRHKLVEDGFRLAQNQLEISHAAHLRERPVRLLNAFAVAQRYDVPLSRMARRLVRENLDLVDDEYRRDPECSEALLRILDADHRVMRTLMEMNEVGLLAAFIPEWHQIWFRWQHVLYHTYTVDVHSIFLVEELRRLGKSEYQEFVPDLTELIGAVEDRPVLFLGCLLHDIGKGLGGDHSNKGADRARVAAERLGLDPERVERIVFLVRHHLVMSHLAQRRDLSDPKVIFEFSQLCGDRTNLRNLYLATFADIRASRRDAWTDWRGQLLRELFERTAELLETGSDDPGKALELTEARVEVRREGARSELVELGVEETRVQSFFDGMPRRYFITHTPRQIARHAQVALRFEDHLEDVLASARREMRGGFTEFILCTRDVQGLYAQVAGTLTVCHINILGSHVYTTRSGQAIEVYRLTTPRGGREERDIAWNQLDETLRAVLSQEVDLATLLHRRRKPIGAARSPSRKGATVVVSNTESDFYTVVDVSANDRIGLLYDLTSTICRHELEIYISKAATVQDQVADTFYLKDRDGKKQRDEAMAQLQRDLLAVAQLGEGEARG